MIKQDSKRTILLIDGYHLLHKGFYGSLKRNKISTNRDGVPINAIYTFIAQINQMIDLKCYYSIIVAFDVGDQCWRRDLYPDYKATRKKTPPELIPQMQIIRDFLTSANIPWYDKEMYEGDDVMGTITRIATKLDYRVHILSNDKDLFQLVDENVKVISRVSKKESPEFIEVQDVIEKVGCLPSQVPDLKSLIGDASDNIKGIKGLHYNTVIKLLAIYQNIETIYQEMNEPDFNFPIKKKLADAQDQVFLNKKIATIQRNVDLGRINFQPLRINWYGYLNFIRKQNMWAFSSNATKHLKEIQKMKVDQLIATKQNGQGLIDADQLWKAKTKKTAL